MSTVPTMAALEVADATVRFAVQWDGIPRCGWAATALALLEPMVDIAQHVHEHASTP